MTIKDPETLQKLREFRYKPAEGVLGCEVLECIIQHIGSIIEGNADGVEVREWTTGVFGDCESYLIFSRENGMYLLLSQQPYSPVKGNADVPVQYAHTTWRMLHKGCTCKEEGMYRPGVYLQVVQRFKEPEIVFLN